MRGSRPRSSVDVNLRSFRPSDAGALLTLSRRAQTRDEEQVGTPLWSTREELDAELGGLDRPAEETLRALEEKGAVAGFGGIELEDEAVLFGPLVHPTFRGRKIGRTLFAASIEIARENQVERLVAAIGVRNAGGRLMLESAGFEPAGGPVAVYRLAPGAHRPVAEPTRGVTTRAAGPGDLDWLLPLCRECFARTNLADDAWRRALARGQVRVAEENGKPVAFVRINPVRRRVYHGVTAEARTRGIGGFVLSEALQAYLRDYPGHTLRLRAPIENVPGSRLYRHQGFVPWLMLQPFGLVL
jgi:ribosomal protein S18 acetylase RimI-like enzyme